MSPKIKREIGTALAGIPCALCFGFWMDSVFAGLWMGLSILLLEDFFERASLITERAKRTGDL